MTPDPKLVEALAEFAAQVAGWERLADVNEMDRRLLDRWVNEFLDRHPRLIQLPEEPDGNTLWWRIRGILIDHIPGEYEERSRTAEYYAKIIMEAPNVRVIPGDPQGVDEQGYRARVYGEFPPEDPQEVDDG